MGVALSAELARPVGLVVHTALRVRHA